MSKRAKLCKVRKYAIKISIVKAQGNIRAEINLKLLALSR